MSTSGGIRLMSRNAVAVALLAAGWILTAGAAHADPEPPPPPPAPPGEAAPPPAGLRTNFGNGTYSVGTDIEPGVYASAGPVEGGGCYWKRSNGDGIVANAMSKKPQTVQIDPGDTTFKSSECQEWQKTDGPPPAQPGPGDLLGQLGSLIAGAQGGG